MVRVNGIGIWYKALETLSRFSVLTNVKYFSSNLFQFLN